MSDDAKTALLVGAFFLAYGVLLAIGSGVKLPHRPRVMIDGIDSRRLRDAMSRRDDLIEQENTVDG